MHKKRLRKKLGRKFKRQAMDLAVIDGAFSAGRAFVSGMEHGALVAYVCQFHACAASMDEVHRIRNTPADYFYRRHFGYPIARPKVSAIPAQASSKPGEKINIHLNVYGQLGPTVNMSSEDLRNG